MKKEEEKRVIKVGKKEIEFLVHHIHLSSVSPLTILTTSKPVDKLLHRYLKSRHSIYQTTVLIIESNCNSNRTRVETPAFIEEG